MQRRNFIKGSAAVMAAAGAASSQAAIGATEPLAAQTPGRGRFKLKYAPHFDMFQNHAGGDLVDQLKFMADEGFTAMEDNSMAGRDAATQERLRQAMDDLGIEMGVFVAHADWRNPSFGSDDPAVTDRLVAEMQSAVEVAGRVGAKWCTVVPGQIDRRIEMEYQTANVIRNLKRCAEVLEPAGLTIVLEPLNPWRDHPGCFLSRIPHAYMICSAVGSPSVKILDDLYHQQITEGNLIPNMDRAWDEIAYFQVGDIPGRNEPGTGEINYRGVFSHIHERGFTGIVGMEHGNSMGGKEGERAVIDAYVAADNF